MAGIDRLLDIIFRSERDESVTGMMADFAYTTLVLVPDGWAKLDGQWVQVAQADRYDVEGPSGVIDGSQVLVTLPDRTES